MKSIFKNSLIAAALVFGAASISQAQVKIGSSPNTIDPNSNLEVQAANGNKTIVNKATGQVTIQDGTQGINRVLTSDANGNSSWRTPADAGIAKMLFGAAQPAGQSVAQNNAGTILTFGVDFDENSGWNATTREYTVAEAGYYNISISGKLISQGHSGGIPGGFVVQVNNTGVWTDFYVLTATSEPGYQRPMGGSSAIKLASGAKIRINTTTCFCTTNATWTASDMTFTVTRVK